MHKYRGFRRIDNNIRWNNNGSKCMSSAHLPPGHICLDPGTYEYTCPECGHKTTVVVPEVALA